MFKKILALVLATMMVLGGMVTVSAAEETAAAEEVVYDYTAAAEDLAALGIFKGKVIDGNTIDFALEDGVTRLQFALFVARIMTGETNDQYWSKVNDNTTPYDDVVNYFGAVSFADENGIIKGKGWIPGIGDNCFVPNGAITFQDAITMAVRALGYKQLQYPNGFITVGEELGLTADLEPIAQDAELTRGQMIQILKNMLYVEVNGAESFAAQNFGLEEKTYVIVATELQALAGADRVYKVDYLDATNKYVALAPLNADGTYDFANVIYLTESDLGLEYNESETKLAYSYTISSYNNFADTYSIVACDTKTVKNYGETGHAIKGGSPYNAVNDKLLSVDGLTYKLVESYTTLNNKGVNANKQPELIVHSMFEGTTDITNAYYMYDAAGNILDKDYNVALLFNQWTQTYYKVIKNTAGEQVGYQVATEADFAACAITTTASTEQFGITTNVEKLTKYWFSQITMIDDNNDGDYDRAIYVPYSIGQYTTASAKGWDVETAANTTSNTTVSKMNGGNLSAIVCDPNGKWVSKAPIAESEITFLGEGRPANGDYVVYYYNPYARLFTVVENIGQPTTGVVTNMTQGTYKYDDKLGKYIFDGATVTLDGDKTYELGYRPYVIYQKGFESIDPTIANYGYSEVIYTSLVGNAYNKLAYLVFNGLIIKVESVGANCGWLAFDYGAATENKGGALNATTYDYTGDVLGVDADGNILVKAYADKSGDQQIVKIGSINGFSYGLLVEDYAALNFQFSGIGVLGTNAMETMKKAVIADFFKTLTADVDDKQTRETERQYLFIVNGVTEDGVYEIYTDHNLYWGDAGLSYRQPAKMTQTDNVSFINGISTTKVGSAVLVTNANTTLLVVGKDGMKTVTGPLNGTLDLHYVAAVKDDAGKVVTPAQQPVWAYSFDKNFIFLASASLNCEDIWYGEFDAPQTTTGYKYYMVLGQNNATKFAGETSVVAAYNAETGKFDYTYKNLYCLNTGSLVTKTVPGGLDLFNSAYTITDSYNYNTPKPIGAIYAEKDGNWTMITDAAKLKEIDVKGTNFKTKYASDSATVFEALMITGYNGYAPIYTASDVVTAKTLSANIVNMENRGMIYDPAVSFKYDVLTFTADTSVMLDDNKYSYDNFTGAVYFNYVEGKSFAGTMIKDDKTATAPIAPVDTLATVKAAAVAELKTADAEKYAKTALEAAVAAINACVNTKEVAVVKAAQAEILADAIAAAKKTETDGIASAHTTALNALKALLTSEADYLEATIKDDSIYTIKEHIDSWVAVAASKTAAELTAAAKEVTDRVAALKAAAAAAEVKINSITAAGVITYQNIKAVKGIQILTGDYFATKVLTVNTAWTTTDTANKYEAVVNGGKIGDYDVTIKMVAVEDPATGVNTITITCTSSVSGKEIPLLTAGESYMVTIIGDSTKTAELIAG